jgi:hypothetical protein
MPYRVTADLLQHLLPIDAGRSLETLRSHTLQVGKRLGDATAEKPPATAVAIMISLDSTFIRSREDGERHWRCASITSRRLTVAARSLAPSNRHHRADSANLWNLGPDRRQGDRFYRRVSGSAHGSAQRGSVGSPFRDLQAEPLPVVDRVSRPGRRLTGRA